MATVTKGRTFSSGEVVTPTKLNTLVDSATVTGIVNADVSATAAIADTKLATISTAGKVSGNAITSGTIGGSTAINTSGTISSGTITANLSGNATTATSATTATTAALATTAATLQTARTIAVSGDVTGTATAFNGSANIVIPAVITAGVIVDADINSAAAIADTKLATISSAGKVSGNAITSGTIGGSTAISTSGTISSGTITANLTGNVTGNVTGNASGLSSPASDGLAKAWVNFNGAGTYTVGTPTAANIRSAHNVSTITKNANGDFTINFSSAFPNANYAVVVTAQGAANNAISAIRAGAAATMVTTSSVRVSFFDTGAGPENPATASVVIFGNW